MHGLGSDLGAKIYGSEVGAIDLGSKLGVEIYGSNLAAEICGSDFGAKTCLELLYQVILLYKLVFFLICIRYDTLS